VEVPIFLTRIGHTGLKKVYHVRQKANSNEGFNLNAQYEKSIFVNDKKHQQSADSNSGARTEGHELEKELFPRVVANKPTGQHAKAKGDVPILFNRITQHASKVVGKSKKMMWVPKGSTPL
jgi:hypothetical protein